VVRVFQVDLSFSLIAGWASHFPANNFPLPIDQPYVVSDNNIPSPIDCTKHLWSDYYYADSVGIAFQNIYDNYDGLRDSFGNFWRHLASEFASYPNILGYELMNEVPSLCKLYLISALDRRCQQRSRTCPSWCCRLP
jgi:hypothetical protein